MKKVIIIAAALLIFCCNSLKAESDTARANSLIAYIYNSASYCRTESINDSIDLLAQINPNYATNNKYILSKAALFFCIKKVDKGYSLIDSLIDIPYGNIDLNERAMAYFQKGRQQRKERKLSESIISLDSCRSIAALVGNNKYAGLALYQKGRILEDQVEYINALKCYNASIEFLEKTENRFTGELHKSVGIVYRKMTLYEEAIRAYNKALAFYFQREDNYGIASVYNSMAILSTSTDHFLKALDFYNKALFYNSNIEGSRSIEINVTNNLGVLYNQTEKFDSALLMLNRAYELSKLQDNKREASKSINNLAIAYKGKGDYNKCLALYHRALKLKKASGTKYGYDINYLGMANAFARMNRFDSSEYYFSLASKYVNRATVSKILYTFYDYYSDLYERKGDYRMSFTYLDSAQHMKADLVKKNYAQIVSNYESVTKSNEEQYEKKKLENELLKEQNFRINEEAKNEKYRAWLFTALVLIALILWFAIITSKNKRKIDKTNEKLNETNKKLEQSIEDNKNLIGIVAHDLKTPFAQISGLLSLLEVKDDEQQSYINTASKVCNDGGKLVNDLVLAHKSESVKVNESQIELTQLFDTLKDKYQGKLAKKNIALHIENNGLSTLTTDKDILSRVLDNFISNAIKFSNPNTSITLGTKANEEGGYQIFIKDQGPGIAENEKSKLFKKYASISNKPTNGESTSGLGLYITKVLSQKINAEVGVNSEKGKGSEFYIKFN